MKSPDMLATDCLRSFEAWWREKRATLPPEDILLAAFVAGYEAGGKCGAAEMYNETMRQLKEVTP
jgi:hypothetical protein